MSDRTSIEWTDASWNPIRARNRATGRVGWHCVHKSEGCRNCYAESFNLRLGTKLAYKPGHERDVDIFLDEKMLLLPLKWRKPRKIFVCSMTDLFADFVNDEMIDRIFAVMALCPSHVFQVLTKRPERMRAYVTRWYERRFTDGPRGGEVMVGTTDAMLLASPPLDADELLLTGHPVQRNVWLGVSVEDQAAAEERIPLLLDTPAAVRWLSCEPLLAPVDLGLHRGWCKACAKLTDGSIDGHCMDPRSPCFEGEVYRSTMLDWVVAGGESGRGARPMHPDWARSLRDQCAAAAVPFLFKQWGAYSPAHSAGIGAVTFSGGSEPGQHPAVAWPDGTVGYGRAEDHGGPGRMLTLWHHKRDAGRLLDGVQHDGYPA